MSSSPCLCLRRAEAFVLPAGDPGWLSASERRRYDGFGSPQRQRQFLCGRWLIRELLAANLGGVPEQQQADIDDEGRSRIAGAHASLSHSGPWIAAVLSQARVGLDVEVLRPRVDVLGLAGRVSGAAELAELEALAGDERLRAFYRSWTLKEAWLKRRGRGLDLQQMQGLRFEPDEQGDLACALLSRANLMLALDVEKLAGSALPTELDGEPLQWQRHRAEPAT